jgi:two-component system, chemotaxis family, sensor kinase CheA
VLARDPYKYFRIEARDLLDQLGKGILDLEKGSPETELVARLLRLAHTLKGAARVVKQPAIADLAHAVEDALAPLRDGAATLPREGTNGVLSLLDAISLRVAGIAEVAAPGSPPRRSSAVEDFSSLGANTEDLDALLDGIVELNVQLGTMRRGVTALKQVGHLTENLSDQLAQPSGAGEGLPLAGAKSRSMADQLRALVVSAQRDLMVGVDRVERELLQVRGTAERLRLVPVELIFTSLERALRDAAQSVSARVSLESSGGEVRLEPHVLSTMQTALVQLMRNAAAHGIEPAGERAASGKPIEGRVKLQVRSIGNQLSFSCTDDGRGVDLEAIRRAARRRGMAQAEANALDSDALLRLILKGGITTSGTVTDVSGRGIGLDVVREAATRLGGAVTLQTAAGEGTTVTIVIPVSLSSLDALVVESAGQTAAIPLSAIRRTLRVASNEVASTAEGESIVLDGQALPFAPLSRTLHPKAVPSRPRTWSAVVIEGGGLLAAVGVDRLLGVQSVVVRPMPKLCLADASVAGASLDADGNPQIIFDPVGLVKAVRSGGATPQVAASPRLPILIVDDSLTTRMLEQSILESAGYEVEIATSGEEGLEKAFRRRFALFLVDVEMPGMDGFEFIQQTRALPSLQSIPAILVTSKSSPEDREHGEKVGAQGFVVKSDFDQGDLLERIRQLVQ